MPPESVCQIMSGLTSDPQLTLKCLFRLHSMALCASSSQLSPHTPYPGTAGILVPTFKEATLFHSSKFLLPLPLPLPTQFPTHPLNFWQTPTLLPSPDMVISCEAFCSPSPPKPGKCPVLHDDADHSGRWFISLLLSSSISRALWGQRGSLGCLFEPQAYSVLSYIRSSAKIYGELAAIL